ncbi:hypothetical protein, partial [Brucella pinnipedialis]|uniref:hypothetical protein n=1 Tax=Brucella pinnipedialis TaxID=120576 RepID=UPI001AEC3E82
SSGSLASRHLQYIDRIYMNAFFAKDQPSIPSLAEKIENGSIQNENIRKRSDNNWGERVNNMRATRVPSDSPASCSLHHPRVTAHARCVSGRLS